MSDFRISQFGQVMNAGNKVKLYDNILTNFRVNKNLKQEDPLSLVLFNTLLEKVI